MIDTTRRDSIPGIEDTIYIFMLMSIVGIFLIFHHINHDERSQALNQRVRNNHSSIHPTDMLHRLNRVTKDVDKDLKEARKAAGTLIKLHEKMKPRKTTPSMGSVPRSVVRRLPLSANVTLLIMSQYNQNIRPQTDIISRLPHELQDIIWGYLIHQPDRMAFALSCKMNAYKQDLLTDVYNKVAIRGPKKQHRLAVLIRLSVWVPDGYRVCFGCTRYCLKISKSEWGGDTAMIDEKYVKDGRLNTDAILRGPRCPRCKHILGMEQLNHKSCVKEFKALLRKHVGPVN